MQKKSRGDGRDEIFFIIVFIFVLSFCKYVEQNCINTQNLLERTKYGVGSFLFPYFTSTFCSKGFKTPYTIQSSLNSQSDCQWSTRVDIFRGWIRRLLATKQQFKGHQLAGCIIGNSRLLEFKGTEYKPTRPFFLVTTLRRPSHQVYRHCHWGSADHTLPTYFPSPDLFTTQKHKLCWQDWKHLFVSHQYLTTVYFCLFVLGGGLGLFMCFLINF